MTCLDLTPKMSKLLTTYSQNLQSNPIATKAATSSTLYALQEIVACLVTKTKPDTQKMIKMALYGGLVSGPLSHFLFSILEKTLKGKDLKTALLKLIAANLIITPTLNSAYLFCLAVIAGASPLKAIAIVKKRLLGLMKVSWIISPLAQFYAFNVHVFFCLLTTLF